MDKLAHGEGLWKALHDLMEEDHYRSALVMDTYNFRLLCNHAELMQQVDTPILDGEGWYELNGWDVLVTDNTSLVGRVKY